MCMLCRCLGPGPHRTAAAAGEGDDLPASTDSPARIEAGGTFSGTLTVGDRDWIGVELVAGRIYDIGLAGSGDTPLFDPLLRVYDAAGTLLAQHDDIAGPEDRNAFLAGFLARQTGTYWLEAAAFRDGHAGGYTLSVSAGRDPVLYGPEEIARQLTHDFWAWYGEDWRAIDAGPRGIVRVDTSRLDADGQRLAAAALAVWEDVTGLRFREVGRDPQIRFDDRRFGAWADTVTEGNTADFTRINVGRSWLDSFGTGLDSYSFQAYVHEIGHALGLGHAGNYNGFASYPAGALFLNDSWQASVMSYFDQEENSWIEASFAYVLTPMVADILAVQSLYGRAPVTRPGNTVYGHGTDAGPIFDPAAFARPVAFTILDSGGRDRIDGSGTAAAQRIDLAPGGISDLFGLTGNVAIAFGTVIEDARGGSGDDMLAGNGAANRLRGGAGRDSIAGLGGDDGLAGGRGRDVIAGGAGEDVIRGGRGGDTLSGGEGADRFLWLRATDSPSGPRCADLVLDFEPGLDLLDLSGIDAVPGGADDAFAFIGAAAFSGTAGELRAVLRGDRVLLGADLDGDARADLAIRLAGTALPQAADLVT